MCQVTPDCQAGTSTTHSPTHAILVSCLNNLNVMPCDFLLDHTGLAQCYPRRNGLLGHQGGWMPSCQCNVQALSVYAICPYKCLLSFFVLFCWYIMFVQTTMVILSSFPIYSVTDTSILIQLH